MIRDYATEELGVTDFEWRYVESPIIKGRYINVVCGAKECQNGKCAHAYGCYPLSDVYRNADTRLIAASKELYNVLREIEDTSRYVTTFNTIDEGYLIIDEVFDRMKVILDRLREVNIASEHESNGE